MTKKRKGKAKCRWCQKVKGWFSFGAAPKKKGVVREFTRKNGTVVAAHPRKLKNDKRAASILSSEPDKPVFGENMPKVEAVYPVVHNLGDEPVVNVRARKYKKPTVIVGT